MAILHKYDAEIEKKNCSRSPILRTHATCPLKERAAAATATKNEVPQNKKKLRRKKAEPTRPNADDVTNEHIATLAEDKAQRKN